jgi:hypothetical protein
VPPEPLSGFVGVMANGVFFARQSTSSRMERIRLS